jgi:hypothetical protein
MVGRDSVFHLLDLWQHCAGVAIPHQSHQTLKSAVLSAFAAFIVPPVYIFFARLLLEAQDKEPQGSPIELKAGHSTDPALSPEFAGRACTMNRRGAAPTK